MAMRIDLATVPPPRGPARKHRARGKSRAAPVGMTNDKTP
jgi:hypothetical protein